MSDYQPPAGDSFTATFAAGPMPADPQPEDATPEPGDTFIELRDGVPYVGTYGADGDDDSGDNTPPWLPS